MKLSALPNRPASLSDSLNGLGFILLLVFIVVAPYPWGAILLPGTFRIEAFAFVIAALAFATRDPDHKFGEAIIPVAALGSIAVLGLWQVMPLSSVALRWISPASARAYEDANVVLQLFGRPPTPPRISIAPSETVSTVLLTLAYIALFTSATILCASRSRRRWLTATIVTAAVIHIVAGLWTDRGERLHSAFINANHFAGYLQIALAFAFAIIWSEVLTGSDRTKNVIDRGERFERRTVHLIWRVTLWSAIAIGITFTRSRAGLAAAAISTAVLMLMAMKRQQTRHRLEVMLTAIAGIALVAFMTRTEAISRFLTSQSGETTFDVRRKIWRSSLEAWRMFPHFGDGLGAFKEAYRRVQPSDVAGLVEQAHNDFLQLMVTGGWIGSLLGAVAFVSIGVILIRSWSASRHREETAFILGGFGALLALTLHGLVDFNMSLPAIPATLAVMLGASVSAARHQSER